MRSCSPAQLLWVVALGCLSTRWFVAVEGTMTTVEPEQACVDFAAGKRPESAWTMADCTDTWYQFKRTIAPGLQRRLRFADVWKETAAELRRAGTPCLSGTIGPNDGVGSTVIRMIAAWVFADEMGCDWVTPYWGRRHVAGGNGTVVYCHNTVYGPEVPKHTDPTQKPETRHCSVMDWIDYFQLAERSVALPEVATFKKIELGPHKTTPIEVVMEEIRETEPAERGWDRVLFQTSLSFAGRHLTSVGNWDENRRQTVRRIVGQLRESFHVHPRPGYEEHPDCAFDPARLNFGIHVRMGDRRGFLGESLEYFHLLEVFMDTVTKEVVGKGLEPPLFHVFSETLVPCPTEETGLFDEFPTWPVHQDPNCWTADVPKNCPEKQGGIACAPDRPGTFHLIGLPAVLHVSPNVHNALSCMIQADGVLMGCSTFGQVAGLMSKGISFFSVHCNGGKSPAQYKTIAPIAVAERGHMWVPVAGSWHDPVLNATHVLSNALEEHLGNKQWA